jgi:hypothetical protein
MTTSVPNDERGVVSCAFLEVSDELLKEFPHLSMVQIYAAVGEARPDCEKYLPDGDAYRDELLSEARIRLHLQGFDSVR